MVKKICSFLLFVSFVLPLIVTCEEETPAPVIHSVIYDANGATSGTVPVDENEYEEGDIIVLMDNTGGLAKTGEAFLGWCEDFIGTGATLAPGQTMTMGDEDMVLYAKWLGVVSIHINPGTRFTHTTDDITFYMRHVPGGYSFPAGVNDDSVRTSVFPYWMSETETTFELWNIVYEWARSNGYEIRNKGCPGNDGDPDTDTDSQEPVTKVSWRDCMVWCNALTEWYNAETGATYACVYTTESGAVIRDSRNSNADQCDDCRLASGATGFRLPEWRQWELAARWRNNATNTVEGYSDPWFTKGNSASGAITGVSNLLASATVAWFSYNSGDSTHPVGQKTANSLTLYDMSGNVFEWLFDSYDGGLTRYVAGGSYQHDGPDIRIGIAYNESPSLDYAYTVGFRFIRVGTL